MKGKWVERKRRATPARALPSPTPPRPRPTTAVRPARRARVALPREAAVGRRRGASAVDGRRPTAFLVFRNAGTGAINVLYRRKDGDLGSDRTGALRPGRRRGCPPRRPSPSPCCVGPRAEALGLDARGARRRARACRARSPARTSRRRASLSRATTSTCSRAACSSSARARCASSSARRPTTRPPIVAPRHRARHAVPASSTGAASALPTIVAAVCDDAGVPLLAHAGHDRRHHRAAHRAPRRQPRRTPDHARRADGHPRPRRPHHG